MGAAGDDAGKVTTNNLANIFGEFKTLAIVDMEDFSKLIKALKIEQRDTKYHQQVLATIEEMKYIKGIVERGENRKLGDNESIAKAMVEYVKKLEQNEQKTENKKAILGHCPTCGAKGVMREKRPNGNDKCANGHTYPSTKAKYDIDHIDLMMDEFMRIKACPGASSEIKQLCDRAVNQTYRNVSVYTELEDLRALKKQLDSGLILYGKEGFSTEFYEVAKLVKE